jgi:hypothetical protein
MMQRFAASRGTLECSMSSRFLGQESAGDLNRMLANVENRQYSASRSGVPGRVNSSWATVGSRQNSLVAIGGSRRAALARVGGSDLAKRF